MRHPPPPESIEAALGSVTRLPGNRAFRDRLSRMVMETAPGDVRNNLPFTFPDMLSHLLLFQRSGTEFRFRVLGETISHLLGRRHARLPTQPAMDRGNGGQKAMARTESGPSFSEVFAPWPEFARLAKTGASWVIDRRREAIFSGVIRYAANGDVPFEIIAIPVNADLRENGSGANRLGFGHMALGRANELPAPSAPSLFSDIESALIDQ